MNAQEFTHDLIYLPNKSNLLSNSFKEIRPWKSRGKCGVIIFFLGLSFFKETYYLPEELWIYFEFSGAKIYINQSNTDLVKLVFNLR